ncbi:TPA: SsrA-binding protein [Candidatus Dependentiae bacterium]|nr:MAG: SsrA-binding protein [candidate division TM6 bacterium GW2011_GWF2_43_87]HBL98252.1 SsrA-binding protein [Candidatus Dependentiae bacterium]
MKIITQNKKAFFDYTVLETFEAGIALTGDEVKSLRAGNANLVGAFVTPHAGRLSMINAYIGPYSHAYQKTNDNESRRTRYLLLHRREINKLMGEVSRGGVTLIPLKLYFNDRGFVKVEIGLCKHKKAHMKKEELRERDIKRDTQRELRGKYDY